MVDAVKLITTAGKAAKSSLRKVIPAIESKPAIGKLAPLQGDTVQFSASAKRWAKPIQEYTLTISKDAKNVQIPFHHEVDTDNLSIRSVLEGIKINSFTKKEKRFLPQSLQKLHEIDTAFSKLQPLEKDCIVYRGRGKLKGDVSSFHADFNIVNSAKKGDIIIPDTAYSYCGIERSLAEHWCPMYKPNRESIMYTIRIPKGAKVSRNLEHGGEVLMPRGAEYKVISKTQQGNHTEVVLEYILPTKDKVAEVEALAKKFDVELN